MTSKLSSEEVARRRKNINDAIASFELEGYIISEEERALYEPYVQGEMTREELSISLNQYISSKSHE